MTTTTNPGLPTVEQVTLHAIRFPFGGGPGAVWRHLVQRPGHVDMPRLVVLQVNEDRIWMWISGSWVPLSAMTGTWTPCDQHGNPVGLVEELSAHREALAAVAHAFSVPMPEPGSDMAKIMAVNRLLVQHRDAAILRAEEAEKALDDWAEWAGDGTDTSAPAARAQLREANDTLAQRLAAAQARIGGLEADLEICRECNAGLVAENKIASMELALAMRTIDEQKAQASAMQERIGWLETELAAVRDPRVSAWPRLVELLDLPADATPDDVVSSVETVVRQHHDAHACFDAEQERAEAYLLDLRAHLGDDGSPEGKALRALVRAARSVLEKEPTDVYGQETRVLHNKIVVKVLDWGQSGYPVAAAALAILLARREQDEDPDPELCPCGCGGALTEGCRERTVHTTLPGARAVRAVKVPRKQRDEPHEDTGAVKPQVIELSPEGQRQFAEAIIDPPPPGELETDLRLAEVDRRELAARIDELHEQRVLLGDPNTPAGKALRRFVKSAADDVRGIVALHDQCDVTCKVTIHVPMHDCHLLDRSEQETAPATAHEPERRTCGGGCNHCRDIGSLRAMAICRHPKVRHEEREVIPMDAPPKWCPGFEPREVKP